MDLQTLSTAKISEIKTFVLDRISKDDVRQFATEGRTLSHKATWEAAAMDIIRKEWKEAAENDDTIDFQDFSEMTETQQQEYVQEQRNMDVLDGLADLYAVPSAQPAQEPTEEEQPAREMVDPVFVILALVVACGWLISKGAAVVATIAIATAAFVRTRQQRHAVRAAHQAVALENKLMY